jgi:hypothetical protein
MSACRLQPYTQELIPQDDLHLPEPFFASRWHCDEHANAAKSSVKFT